MAESMHLLVLGIILAVGITLATAADTAKEIANTSTSDKGSTSTVEPTTLPSTPAVNTTEAALPKGRAVIHLPPANSSFLSKGDNASSSSVLNSPPPFPGGLDDVSMDNDDEVTTAGGCVAADGVRYANGQRWNVGCQERCTCVSGRTTCTTRCEAPHRTRTEVALVVAADPMCTIKPTDDCCALLQCAQHEERSDVPTTPPTAATSSCTFENKTHALGASFNSGCDTCVCGKDGRVTCKPRCPEPQMPESHQLCFKVPDRQDSCCFLVVCDVEEVERTGGMYDPSTMLYGETTSVPQADARALNATAAAISLPGGGPLPANASVETSPDGHLWSHLDAPNGVVAGLRPGRTYFIRLLVDDVPSPAVEVTLPEESEVASNATSNNATSVIQGDHCLYKGEKRQFGAQFHDGCMALCECSKTGVECAPIDCPTNFGLDILNPNCVDWETLPRDFKPNPPHCCPDKVVCRSNGTCIYANETYPNYSDIPIEVTGCEQRCYCDNGNVTCSPMCPTVSLHPPVLPDCPMEPILALQPGDDCCRVWMCPSHNSSQSGGQTPLFPIPTAPPTTLSSASTADSTRPPSSTTGAPLSVQYLGPFAPIPETKKETTSKTPLLITTPELAAITTAKILPHTTATSTSLKYPKPTAPTFDDNSPATTVSSPNKIATSFSPTIDPSRPTTDPTRATSDHPKLHKHHPHYIGPFVIDNDDEKDPSDLDFIPGPFNPKESHFNKPQNESFKAPPIAVPKPLPPVPPTLTDKHEPHPPFHAGRPPLVYNPSQQGPIPVYVPAQHEQPQYHPEVYRPPYATHPEYQLVHVNNQGYPEPYPKQTQTGGHPPSKNTANGPNLPPLSNEELYHLQSGLQPGQPPNPIPPDSNHEVYYVHGGVPKSTPSSPQDVYHIVPHSPTVPIEEIIAHIRQQEQQSEQHQKPLLMQPDDYLQVHVQKQGRPNPPVVSPAVRPPVLPPYAVPVPGSHPSNLPGPFGHGHGHGLGDVDDLSTETSRHPAPQQQLAQLLSNQSYTGLPPLDQRPPFLPPGFAPGNFPSNHNDEIEVLRTDPSDTAISLAFAVPRVLVGLHGRVEVRYTSELENNDENTWERQILAPPGDLISTPELEFELNNLHPNTNYKIRVSVTLRNLHTTPSSSIITVRTHPRAEPPTTLPPQIPIDPDLAIVQVNSTWARLAWRKASPFELQFIDGVQLRYKEIDGKVYAATPLIHRAVTSYTLDGLKPDTKYVAGIVFVPFADQTTELQSPQTVTFTTGIENDPYKFDLNLEVSHIKSTSVELNWTGVPYPEDKFVNIFRAIYQSEAGKEDFSSFKVAKRDSPPRTLIQELKPGTRYRLWLEAYLTNGRIKKSNVQDFMTKAGSGPSAGASMQDKLEGASAASEPSDYYGALVAVTILAILGGIVSLTLLLILFKRCNQNKAAISTCRKSQSAYDNPSYKVEIQQETMDL